MLEFTAVVILGSSVVKLVKANSFTDNLWQSLLYFGLDLLVLIQNGTVWNGYLTCKIRVNLFYV